MKKIREIIEFLGGTAQLTGDIFAQLMTRPFYFRLFLDQLYQVGIRSFPLVFIVAASVGMVMALQFGVGLEKFGGKLYVPKIVSLSIVRELGPVFASLMVAARIGAGFTSEIGSMTVTQQIDAIRALGTSPIKRIVIPRVLACLVGLPILCIFANTIGVLGGLIVGASDLGLDPHFYYQKIVTTLTTTDYMSGLLKTPFFALCIGIPSCYYGLTSSGGTNGVGQSTTRAVVTACILILIGDYFLTKLFLVFE
jgi:phospholipid/cholesterol/gamma-HCH transport system permease protein